MNILKIVLLRLAKIFQLQIFSKLAPGLLKRKKQPYTDHAVKATRTKASKTQLRIMIHVISSLRISVDFNQRGWNLIYSLL